MNIKQRRAPDMQAVSHDLTHTQERALRLRDLKAWVEYSAPELLRRMRAEPDMKAIRWQMAKGPLQAEVKRLIELEKAA